MKTLDIAHFGQVFTPEFIIEIMLDLMQNKGRILEPSCGDGAFLRHLPQSVGIEIDKTIAHPSALNMDFFAYPLSESFDTIIGNPPFVRYQDILDSTKSAFAPFHSLFDKRTNLYLFFIYKCILHLKSRGELIFITPRDFLKSTASVRLNDFIHAQGTITHFFDLGDSKIFSNAEPNCAIWRFEKDNFSRQTHFVAHSHRHKFTRILAPKNRYFQCVNGQIIFSKNAYSVPFSKLFFVKVGAVSGADSIFTSQKHGNMDFVGSQTAKSGATKRMIYGEFGKHSAYLKAHKAELLRRKIRAFSEANWYQWGRDYFKSELPRIYVNTKTRNKRPFFLHDCKAYDGSILAIFPRFEIDSVMLQILCDKLNALDWAELGFVCDGRFLFSQRSLENALLDESFSEILAQVGTKLGA